MAIGVTELPPQFADLTAAILKDSSSTSGYAPRWLVVAHQTISEAAADHGERRSLSTRCGRPAADVMTRRAQGRRGQGHVE